MSGTGIDEDDLARIAAFNDRDKPHASELLGGSDSVRSGNGEHVIGPRTREIADHLRETVAVDDTLVTKARRIARETDRSGASVARSLSALADQDVDGLEVQRGESDRSVHQWVIERTESDGS